MIWKITFGFLFLVIALTWVVFTYEPPVSKKFEPPTVSDGDIDKKQKAERREVERREAEWREQEGSDKRKAENESKEQAAIIFEREMQLAKQLAELKAQNERLFKRLTQEIEKHELAELKVQDLEARFANQQTKPQDVAGQPAEKISSQEETSQQYEEQAQLQAEPISRQASNVAVEPPKSLNNLDRLLDEMGVGAIAFNTPSDMNIEETRIIQLILSPTEKVAQITLSKAKGDPKKSAYIKIGDTMEARLTGHMFQISAITPETQGVSKLQRTEWNWEIYPKEEGSHDLHLTLSAILEVDGNRTQRVFETYDEIINVNVTVSQRAGLFIKKNWQWLWAALLVPIVGWLWRRKSKLG